MADAEIAQLKTCTKCGCEQPLGHFPKDRLRADGLFPWCRGCKSTAAKANYKRNPAPYLDRAAARRRDKPEAMQEWRTANQGRIRTANAKFYAENRDSERERWKRYAAENPGYYKAARLRNIERYRAKARERRATPQGKLNSNVARAILRSLRDGSKAAQHWEGLVGYSLSDLMRHLEQQFQPGMSWDNHGQFGWHIDHIVPLAAFNFAAPDHIDFKRAWALTNLRPLWWQDNLKKHAKLDGPFQPSLAI